MPLIFPFVATSNSTSGRESSFTHIKFTPQIENTESTITDFENLVKQKWSGITEDELSVIMCFCVNENGIRLDRKILTALDSRDLDAFKTKSREDKSLFLRTVDL